MDTEGRTALACDLYGTLLSTDAIVERLKEHFPGPKAHTISPWRRYQVEDTWRLNSMERYDSLDKITRNSLQHALDHAAVDNLLVAYDHLSSFPDIDSTLRQLTRLPNLTMVFFSNGTQSMVTNPSEPRPGLVDSQRCLCRHRSSRRRPTVQTSLCIVCLDGSKKGQVASANSQTMAGQC